MVTQSVANPGELKPHPKNYRNHPPTQIDHIAASIREHGFYRNVVVTSDYTILAGHGQTLAAQQLGLTEIPIAIVDIKPGSPQALKILAADNTLQDFAIDDLDALASLLETVDAGSPDGLLGTGYDDDALADLFGSIPDAPPPEPDDGPDRLKFNRTVEAPIYEPTRPEPPPITELADPTRTDELITSIEDTPDIPPDVKQFLIAAAARHTTFKFDAIAEYYAHAEPEIQRLMEDSALVIRETHRKP